jgi:hypothetical protein
MNWEKLRSQRDSSTRDVERNSTIRRDYLALGSRRLLAAARALWTTARQRREPAPFCRRCVESLKRRRFTALCERCLFRIGRRASREAPTR